MEYRTLGKTGLRISAIGLGCWESGGSFWKTHDQDSIDAFSAALSSGINFFDTAYDYGNGHSEQLVGRFIKEHPNENVTVATKVPPKDGHWPAIDDNIENVFPKEYILDYAMKSYKNLGERTIDLLQLHVWKDSWIDESSWQDAFKELKNDGIARFFGVSVNDHSPNSALDVAASGKIDSIQVIYNIFDQSPEEKLFPICIKNNVGVIARVPLDEGSLGGKFTKETEFDDWRRDYFTPERLNETLDHVEKLRPFENNGRSLAQTALQFCLHHEAVTTVIAGSTNSKHVSENAMAADRKLTADEVEKLKNHEWERNFYPHW